MPSTLDALAFFWLEILGFGNVWFFSIRECGIKVSKMVEFLRLENANLQDLKMSDKKVYEESLFGGCKVNFWAWKMLVRE